MGGEPDYLHKKEEVTVSPVHAASLTTALALGVSIRFLSPLKCFFQLSIMFILFK